VKYRCKDSNNLNKTKRLFIFVEHEKEGSPALKQKDKAREVL